MIDINAVAAGSDVVRCSLNNAVAVLGESVVSAFMEKIPNRGDDLWDLFIKWRRNRLGLDFLDFVESVVQSCRESEV